MREELLKIIDECDVVSFDVFDTLLFRNLYRAVDLFKILANVAKSKYGIENFYNVRIEAEKESRTELNHYECNLDDIYEVISKYGINKRVVENLKKTEINLEKEFCVVNPFMKSIYDYCLKNNKKVIFISDMYLNKKIILDILGKIGYKNVELYLSNEYHETKGTSKLYEIVYNKYKFKKERWVHIGDNLYSDYEVSIQFGIRAYHYKNVSTYSDVVPNSIFESIVLGIQNNYLYNGLDIDYWDDFGVRYASLIYFGFTKWLYDLTKQENNLFFLARDGYLIKEIYDLLNDKSRVFTSYIYCSRKSIQIPSLLNDSKDKLVTAFTQGYSGNFEISLRDFLHNSCVDIDNIVDDSIFKAFGFKGLDDIICKKNYNCAKKLLARLVDHIKSNLEDSQKKAISYLRQEKLDDFDKINIMDIGWGGSIQEAISNLLDKEVIGYYFGTINLQKKDSFCNMFGYYFDLDQLVEDKDEVLSNVMMYELLFSAPHGSTLGYRCENKKIVPVLDDDIKYNQIVSKFQKSAIDIIKKYLNYIDYFDSLDKYFCVRPYQKFLKRQDIYDVKMFADLSTDYLLGSNEKVSYVSKVTSSDIYSQVDAFKKKVEQSLWKDAFYIEDAINADCYVKAKIILQNLKYYDLSLIPLECVKLYLNFGNGYHEDDIVLIPYKKMGDSLSFVFEIPHSVKEIRIDPVEGFKIVIKNLIIFTDVGNVKCHIGHRNLFLGKVLRGIYIVSKDPRIIVKNLEGARQITFSANITLVK